MDETRASQAPRWKTLLHTRDIPVMSPHVEGEGAANDKSVKRVVLSIRSGHFVQ